MIEPFVNAVKVEELKNRLLFLFFALAIFVFATHLSVPGVDLAVWSHLLSQGAIFSFIGLITGGALNNFAVVAMGITPYINASIMMQLLTVIVPKLEELQKEGGEMGRKQIAMYTRLLTVILSIFEACMMTFPLRSLGVFENPGILHLITIVLILTAGSTFLLWLGELITDKGIGNGVSILIFAGIILRYPTYVGNVFQITRANFQSEGPAVLLRLLAFIVAAVALIVAIVALTQGIRKVPIQQPKRIVGRRVMGGQSTYLPIKVDNGGVIAIIFAISVLYFPMTVLNFLHANAQAAATGFWPTVVGYIQSLFSPTSAFFNLFYAFLVIFFTYFYAYITFNVDDVADNLKKSGSFIPGIRPGKPTAEALGKILTRITCISAVILAIIAVVPSWVTQLSHVSFYLGSTSMLIIVGVILETIQQIQARLIMRHYRGILR